MWPRISDAFAVQIVNELKVFIAVFEKSRIDKSEVIGSLAAHACFRVLIASTGDTARAE